MSLLEFCRDIQQIITSFLYPEDVYQIYIQTDDKHVKRLASKCFKERFIEIFSEIGVALCEFMARHSKYNFLLTGDEAFGVYTGLYMEGLDGDLEILTNYCSPDIPQQLDEALKHIKKFYCIQDTKWDNKTGSYKARVCDYGAYGWNISIYPIPERIFDTPFRCIDRNVIFPTNRFGFDGTDLYVSDRCTNAINTKTNIFDITRGVKDYMRIACEYLLYGYRLIITTGNIRYDLSDWTDNVVQDAICKCPIFTQLLKEFFSSTPIREVYKPFLTNGYREESIVNRLVYLFVENEKKYHMENDQYFCYEIKHRLEYFFRSLSSISPDEEKDALCLSLIGKEVSDLILYIHYYKSYWRPYYMKRWDEFERVSVCYYCITFLDTQPIKV